MTPAAPPLLALAAGGTAGHIYPGIAVAHELERRGWRVLFLGTASGREQEIVPRHGYELAILPGRPYQRQAAGPRVRALAAVGPAFWAAYRLLRRRSVAGVVGFGGYAAVGPVLAGRALGLWTALLEPNVRPGLANRLLSRFADRIYAGRATLLAGPRVAPVGVPIRDEVAAVARRPRAASPQPGILVLGDPFLDARLPEVVAALVARGVPQRVLHQGRACYPPEVPAVCVGELADLGRAYAEAAVVVCRAGAGTLAEIAAAGCAALVVPLADSAEDHQSDNARAWAERAAALVLAERDWSCARAADLLGRLLRDESCRQALGARARTFAAPDAARALVADAADCLQRRHPELAFPSCEPTPFRLPLLP